MKEIDAMNEVDWQKYLGEYVGSPNLEELFTILDIKKPKLKKNEYDAYSEKHSAGIELTFTLESCLDTEIEYPEDSLVLVNIRFYLMENSDFKAFTGKLPFGLDNIVYENDMIRRFGKPELNPYVKNQLKWVVPPKYIFCLLDRNTKQVAHFGLQLIY